MVAGGAGIDKKAGGEQVLRHQEERDDDRTRRARDDSRQPSDDRLAKQVAFLQRSIGNAATARLLTSPRTAPARAPGVLAVQRLREGEVDATASDEDMQTLGYKAITSAVGDKPITYKNVQLQPNGALVHRIATEQRAVRQRGVAD